MINGSGQDGTVWMVFRSTEIASPVVALGDVELATSFKHKPGMSCPELHPFFYWYDCEPCGAGLYSAKQLMVRDVFKKVIICRRKRRFTL